MSYDAERDLLAIAKFLVNALDAVPVPSIIIQSSTNNPLINVMQMGSWR